MNFFEQLFPLADGCNFTMKIMRKADKLTINFIPEIVGKKDAKQVPLTITGTPQELDADFFSTITAPVEKTVGLITNIAAAEKELKELEKKEADAKKKVETKKSAPVKKPTPVKKKSSPPAKKSTPPAKKSASNANPAPKKPSVKKAPVKSAVVAKSTTIKKTADVVGPPRTDEEVKKQPEQPALSTSEVSKTEQESPERRSPSLTGEGRGEEGPPSLF